MTLQTLQRIVLSFPAIGDCERCERVHAGYSGPEIKSRANMPLISWLNDQARPKGRTRSAILPRVHSLPSRGTLVMNSSPLLRSLKRQWTSHCASCYCHYLGSLHKTRRTRGAEVNRDR